MQKLEKDKASLRSVQFSHLSGSSPYTGGVTAAVMSAGDSQCWRPLTQLAANAGTRESALMLLKGKHPPYLPNVCFSLTHATRHVVFGLL